MPQNEIYLCKKKILEASDSKTKKKEEEEVSLSIFLSTLLLIIGLIIFSILLVFNDSIFSAKNIDKIFLGVQSWARFFESLALYVVVPSLQSLRWDN